MRVFFIGKCRVRQISSQLYSTARIIEIISVNLEDDRVSIRPALVVLSSFLYTYTLAGLGHLRTRFLCVHIEQTRNNATVDKSFRDEYY